MMQNDKPAIMQIRCKFGSLGETERQFHSPHGFCMGPNEEIIVADTFNHRIQVCTSILQNMGGGEGAIALPLMPLGHVKRSEPIIRSRALNDLQSYSFNSNTSL